MAKFPPLPQAEFRSWHGEPWKSPVNPTGVCNAFVGAPRIPEEQHWIDKGYHSEPLFTAHQLRARDLEIWRMAMEEAAKACARCGRPAGASDGSTYVCGSSADAEKVIRALLEPSHD